MEAQAANVPVAQASVPEVDSVDEPMTEVAPRERGTKRGADDSQDGDGHKRARIGEFPSAVLRMPRLSQSNRAKTDAAQEVFTYAVLKALDANPVLFVQGSRKLHRFCRGPALRSDRKGIEQLIQRCRHRGHENTCTD